MKPDLQDIIDALEDDRDAAQRRVDALDYVVAAIKEKQQRETAPASYPPIPTAARAKVRAMVKSHPNFVYWCRTAGVASRGATNHQLIDFARQHGLYDAVLATIATTVPA